MLAAKSVYLPNPLLFPPHISSSSTRFPVSFISASSSFSFIEHLFVANGHAWMIQESDVCYTTSMYVTQSWCIPDEIDLCYFRICIITHNNNLFNKTSIYSRSKFCPQKTPYSTYHPRYQSFQQINFIWKHSSSSSSYACWSDWFGNLVSLQCWNWFYYVVVTHRNQKSSLWIFKSIDSFRLVILTRKNILEMDSQLTCRRAKSIAFECLLCETSWNVTSMTS